MNTRNRLSLLLGGLLIFCSAAGAMVQEEPSPSSTTLRDTLRRFFDDYMDAMRTADLAEAARLMHPEALAQFKEIALAMESRDASGNIAADLFGVGRGSRPADVAPEALYISFMETLTRLRPEMKELLRSTRAKLLGVVGERNMIHIVYRSRASIGSYSGTQVETITVKKHGSQWRALLSASLEETLDEFLQRL